MYQRSMEDIKHTIGANIVALRRARGMTQAELATELSYSDKAVSKWECGDAVPDILVLTQVATFFGVSLDYLVEAEHATPAPDPAIPRAKARTTIAALSFMLVWLLATLVFVLPALFGVAVEGMWLSFIYAIPVSLLVVYILSCLWGRRWMKYTLLSLFVWSLILAIFLSIIVLTPPPHLSAWMLFLLGIPAQVIILLWSSMRASHKKAQQVN